MLPSFISVTAAGASPWVHIDRGQNAFGVGFNVDFDSAGSMTYKIEHTFDSFKRLKTPKTITRSGTTVTVTFGENHDLNTGDYIAVMGANKYVINATTGIPGTSDVFDGEWPSITVTSTTVITYTVTSAGNTVGDPTCRILLIRVQPNATITAATASGDGSYTTPITALRINVTSYSAGKATLAVVQGRK